MHKQNSHSMMTIFRVATHLIYYLHLVKNLAVLLTNKPVAQYKYTVK